MYRTNSKKDEYHFENINYCLRVLNELDVLIPKEKNKKQYLCKLFVDQNINQLL